MQLIYNFIFPVNSAVLIITTLTIFKVELAALVQIEKCKIWLYTIGDMLINVCFILSCFSGLGLLDVDGGSWK